MQRVLRPDWSTQLSDGGHPLDIDDLNATPGMDIGPGIDFNGSRW